MAGSFGFERAGGHYDVSMKVGERSLLPTVRKIDDETLIIANGFSCREQIEQGTHRKALHVAEVIQMAMQGNTESIPESFPENRSISRNRQLLNAAKSEKLSVLEFARPLGLGVGLCMVALWLGKQLGTRIAQRKLSSR